MFQDKRKNWGTCRISAFGLCRKGCWTKKQFENPEDTLPYLTDSLKAENVRKNR